MIQNKINESIANKAQQFAPTVEYTQQSVLGHAANYSLMSETEKGFDYIEHLVINT